MAQRDWSMPSGVADAFQLTRKPTGSIAETVPRGAANLDTNVAMTSGRQHHIAIALQAGQVVTSITFVSVAAAASPTQQLAGLYSSDGITLLRASNNKTSTAWGANTASTFTLSSTFTTTYTGLHYVALMVVATSLTLAAITQAVGVVGIAPILSGSSSTGRTTSLASPAAALTAVANVPYAYVS